MGEQQKPLNVDARILVVSDMRAGTTWLTEMFKDNVRAAHKEITHEGFRGGLVRRLHVWETDGTHISVGHDGPIIDELYRRFPDLRVAFCFRDPVDHIISLLSTYHGGTGGSGAGNALVGASWHWGAQEQAIRTVDRLGIKATYWHFDYFTTLEGFCEMATTLDLPLKEEPTTSTHKNASDPNKRMHREEWPVITEALVREYHSNFERLSVEYDKAKAYADDRLAQLKGMQSRAKPRIMDR